MCELISLLANLSDATAYKQFAEDDLSFGLRLKVMDLSDITE
jgi:hypothetical protein